MREHGDRPSYPASFFSSLSLDAGLALQPPHILHDLIDIRRSDGVSWIVDANHIRHHIPYAQDDVCWRDKSMEAWD